jgi:hypothetical protein
MPCPTRWQACSTMTGSPRLPLSPPSVNTSKRLVEQEARAFFGELPDGLFLILDDAEPLHKGKFRAELRLLRDRFRERGWRAELGCPEETRWDGRQLFYDGQGVVFIINRSTDFFWRSEAFSAVQAAYRSGGVHVGPLTPSPMPHAAISACWNGFFCPTGMKCWASGQRSARS